MKKIAVITSTRAEYGLLYHAIKGIDDSKSLDLNLYVTGMHLSEKFGLTYKNIEEDGFKIHCKIDLGVLESSNKSIINQSSILAKELHEAFELDKPEAVIVLGDRYELIPISQVCLLMNIPLIHIHGGEITTGAIDDYIRHAVTKMSSYHFPATKSYAQRIVQMGEDKRRVMTLGAPGLEAIKNLDFLCKEDLERNLGVQLNNTIFLITYHPVTAEEENGLDNLLKSLENHKDVSQVITLPNSDLGHEEIIEKINNYAKDRDNVHVFKSLGMLRYLSMMKISSVVVGNSSSGIIEAPFFGVGTLNIGERQNGRLMDSSIISSTIQVDEINKKLNDLKSQKFEQSKLYGDGTFSKMFIKFLEETELTCKKGFVDL